MIFNFNKGGKIFHSKWKILFELKHFNNKFSNKRKFKKRVNLFEFDKKNNEKILFF